MSFSVLDPTGNLPEIDRVPLTTRDGGLHGAVLGVLTNNFRGEDLPAAIANEIGIYGKIAEVIRHEKSILSRSAADDVIAELAATADCVIVGVCG